MADSAAREGRASREILRCEVSSTRTARKGAAAVSGPFIFIATNTLKPGKIDERERVQALSQFISSNEPRLVAFNEYANEGGTEVGVVQIHPDAQSMRFHMNLIREHAASAYGETLEATTAVQVLGTPDDAILDMLRQQAGAGVEITIKPYHLAGFTRVAPDSAPSAAD
jgi:hypothetical protein